MVAVPAAATVLEAEAVIVRVGADQLAEVTAPAFIVTPDREAPIVNEVEGKVMVTVSPTSIPLGVVKTMV
jgi:hypothetical protein